MPKVTKATRSAADILKETASDMGVIPEKPQNAPVTPNPTKADTNLASLRSLVTEHEKVLIDASVRIAELEKLIKHNNQKVSNLDMRVGMVIDPQERDLPAEVTAGLNVSQLYAAVISGSFAGIFQHARNLNSFDRESYRETMITHVFQMGDTFLKSLDKVMGPVIDADDK